MTTNTLILIIGVYMLAGSLAMFLRPNMARAVLNEFKDSPGLCFALGAIMFFPGAALLSFYHDFTDLKRGILTVLAGAMTLEALMLLIWPPALLGFAERLAPGPAATRIFAGVTFVAGIVLTALAHT